MGITQSKVTFEFYKMIYPFALAILLIFHYGFREIQSDDMLKGNLEKNADQKINLYNFLSGMSNRSEHNRIAKQSIQEEHSHQKSSKGFDERLQIPEDFVSTASCAIELSDDAFKFKQHQSHYLIDCTVGIKDSKIGFPYNCSVFDCATMIRLQVGVAINDSILGIHLPGSLPLGSAFCFSLRFLTGDVNFSIDTFEVSQKTWRNYGKMTFYNKITFHSDLIAAEEEAYSLDWNYPFKLDSQLANNFSNIQSLFDITINLTLRISFCHLYRDCRAFWERGNISMPPGKNMQK